MPKLTKQEEFEVLAMPLIDWLKRNYSPHTTIIIDHSGAELMKSQISVAADE